MQHIHYVGPGIAAKMAELDDTPATCERYPFNTKIIDGRIVVDELAKEISFAWGRSGMCYAYIKDIDQTIVGATLDQVIAGGVV